MRKRIVAGVLALGACGGGGGAAVEATFAPELRADGVWAVEAERRERADSTGFRLGDLTPGPVSLRLLEGADTVAELTVLGLPPGATLRLHELRVDGDSRLAFPRAVELEGAQMVTVNGMRMAPEARVPLRVDVRGVVLAWSSDAGALLVRPEDARLPDLRVVVGGTAEVVGADGGAADVVALRPGDSIRVEGRRDGGYVLAARLTVPTGGGEALADSPAAAREDAVRGDAGREESQGNAGRGEASQADAGREEDGQAKADAADPGRPARAVVIPRAPAAPARPDDARGRGRGRGNGEGRGKGEKGKGGP